MGIDEIGLYWQAALGRPSSEASSTAAAPSVSGVELAAVSVPRSDFSNEALSVAIFSRLISSRMLLSRNTPANGTTRSSM